MTDQANFDQMVRADLSRIYLLTRCAQNGVGGAT